MTSTDKDTIDLEKLVSRLKNDVSKIENETLREAAKLRLEEAARIYNGEDRIISSEEIAENLRTRPKVPGMMSGIATLDKILDGFTPQQVIVLAGITKHGKTSFSIDMTRRLHERHPMWLPFEESAQELVQKFLDRNQEPPVFYTPLTMKDNTMPWIESRIIESKVKFDSEIVFIDHLGFITPKTDNEAIEIGRVMRALKGLAKKWNVVIFLMCHLTKTQIDKHPNLEDLRGSAAIGQEADTVMFIWRETTKKKHGEIEITNLTNLSVQANRRTGHTGNVKLVYTKGKYLEQDWQHDSTPAGYRKKGDKDDWGDYSGHGG